MKTIFTKLGILLFCGAFAMVGCSDISADLREYDERLNALTQEAANLRTEITTLADDLETLYVKKTELETLSDEMKTVNAALAELDRLVESKADDAQIKEAIKALEEKIADLKGCVCEPGQDGEDGQPGEQGPEGPQGPAGETPDLSGIISRIEAIEDAIKGLGCTCEPSEPCTCEPIDLTELNQSVKDLQDDLKAYKEATDKTLENIKERLDALEKAEHVTVAELQAELEGVNEAIKTAVNESETALRGEISAAKTAVETAFAAADAVLAQRLDAVEKALENIYTKEEVDAAIAAAVAQYKGVNDEIKKLGEQLAALAGRVDALATELRDIVTVPSILVNGTPAVEFKSLVYVPMAADNDEVPSVEGTDDYEILGSFETAAYYHFNPSDFDVKSAQYAVLGAEVQTRAAEEPVATVGEVTKEGGKVKVQLFREKGAGNMFALAVTLQSGATIHSDYSMILDTHVAAADIAIVDINDVPLYTTLADVVGNDAQLALESNVAYDFAKFVKPIDELFASFGLEYKYSVVSGDAVISDAGIADLTKADGAVVVKIEAVDGENVVRRAYVKMDVTYVEPEIPGVYFNATATASVVAERIAFEVKDILVWAKALKDEPNTIEILKEVAQIAKNIAEIQAGDKNQIEKTYLIKEEAQKAYTLLNGVPGFVKKYQTFTGTGEAKVKAQFIPEIVTVEELAEVVKMIEEEYNLRIGDRIYDFVPDSWEDNILVKALLEAIKNFSISDIFENEYVFNTLKYIENLAGGFNFDAVNKIIEQAVKNAVGENNYGEVAARISAEAKARAAAKAALEASFNAANDQLLANFANGTWGKVLDFVNVDLNLDNEIVAKILEKLQLTEVAQVLQTTLTQISVQGKDLVKYTYDAEQIAYTVEAERYEVK